MIIRNDDVSIDTNIREIKNFCRICDKYGVKIIQAITPVGHTIFIDSKMDNKEIADGAGLMRFSENTEVFNYLKSRNDLIGTHGWIHTHKPTTIDQTASKALLESWGFKPEYAVLPFNEPSDEYTDEVLGMKVLGKTDHCETRLEGQVEYGKPVTTDIIYCHSWRFKPGNKFNYSWDLLDKCLATITGLK